MFVIPPICPPLYTSTLSPVPVPADTWQYIELSLCQELTMQLVGNEDKHEFSNFATYHVSPMMPIGVLSYVP